MKIVAAVSIGVLLAVPGLAQSQSVFVEDLTGQEVTSAVAAGKTTAIYCSGAVHADGPAIAVGKHAFLCRSLAERAATELGNALVLPINPYAPNSGQMNHSSPPSGSVIAGTISLSEETYGLVTKDVVNTAILAAGFKNVMIMGDHSQGQDVLKRVAKELDQEWKSKGAHVYYIDLAPSAKTYMRDYFAKQGIVDDRKVDPTDRPTRIDDNSELSSIDRDHKWVRQDAIPSADRNLSTPKVGKTLTDWKVSTIVQQIRNATSKTSSSK